MKDHRILIDFMSGDIPEQLRTIAMDIERGLLYGAGWSLAGEDGTGPCLFRGENKECKRDGPPLRYTYPKR